MKILITSGSTLTPIDRVRGITNIFSGRTGFEIAKHAVYEGHKVTLLGNSSMQIIDRNSEVVLVSRKELPKILINKLEAL
jgi:phosphopantothenoylcysteine synthetase/decarboxylase